jgi:phosphoglycerate dehydrogenase-like enzyme
MRVAVLDDYQASAFQMADWKRVPSLKVISFTDHVHDEDELVTRLEEFDVIMRIRERTEFPRSVLTRLPRLKLLLATGMRNARSIDMAAAKELGITVCGTEVHAHTTVELVWGLILSLMRRLPQEVDSLRAGGWQIGLGSGLQGKTLGIIGLGSMGIPVSRVGRAFGMKVVAWSPNLTPERTQEHQVECVSKSELFATSDVITLHMPDTDKTNGIVGASDIGLMKPTAFFINTSRPKLVDQDALLNALTSRAIAGAGVDVFDVEPLPADDPYRWLPNVVATPHIGFVTRENYRIFFEQSLENLEAFVGGAPKRIIG